MGRHKNNCNKCRRVYPGPDGLIGPTGPSGFGSFGPTGPVGPDVTGPTGPAGVGFCDLVCLDTPSPLQVDQVQLPGYKILYRQSGDCFKFCGRYNLGPGPYDNLLTSDSVQFDVPFSELGLDMNFNIDEDCTSGKWVVCYRLSADPPGQGESVSGNMFLRIINGDTLRFVIRNNYLFELGPGAVADPLTFTVCGMRIPLPTHEVSGRVYFSCGVTGPENPSTDFPLSLVNVTATHPNFPSVQTTSVDIGNTGGTNWSMNVTQATGWTITVSAPAGGAIGQPWVNGSGNAVQSPVDVLAPVVTQPVSWTPPKASISGIINRQCENQLLSLTEPRGCQGCGTSEVVAASRDVRDITNTSSRTVRSLQLRGASFNRVPLFERSDVAARDVDLLASLKLQPDALRSLYESPETTFSFTLPASDGNVYNLYLYEVNLLAPGADVPIRGRYYHGSVEGHKSIVSISVYPDKVVGIIGVDETNIDLVQVRDSDEYVMMNRERNLKGFTCLSDTNQAVDMSDLVHARDLLAKCPTVYFDACPSMLAQLGTKQAVIDYVTDMFNAVKQIYAQVQPTGPEVTLLLAGITAWAPGESVDMDTICVTSVDNDKLAIYRDFRIANVVPGDLKHIVEFTNDLSGVAYVGGLCNTFGYGYSGLDSNEVPIAAYPTYTWNVSTIAHELGHNFNARHTFDCIWIRDGNPNQSLGGCSAPVGGCPDLGESPEGNTIMGYCGGYPLTNGFGPQPAAVVRSYIDAAPCVQACPGPTGPTGSCDNFPLDAIPGIDYGAASGQITTIVSGGTGPYTVDWSGAGVTGSAGSTGTYVITGLECGTYTVDASDSSDPACTAQIQVNVHAGITGTIPVTISGGPCGLVDIPVAYNPNTLTYTTSQYLIPQGIPGDIVATRGKYVLSVDLTGTPFDTFYKVFGTDVPGGTQVTPQTVDVTVDDFDVIDGLPFVLGNTTVGNQ